MLELSKSCENIPGMGPSVGIDIVVYTRNLCWMKIVVGVPTLENTALI